MTNKDGTISRDEVKQRRALMIRANSMSEKLFRSLKQKANQIGGPFRGPGIKAEVKSIIRRNLEAFL